MTSIDDTLRSFGMSTLLISDELRQLEAKFGIDLGLGRTPEAVSGVDAYPQFERAVRVEAADMSRHYEMFYCLEKAIRRLISETLQEASGADWWNSGRVPQGVLQAVVERQKTEVDSGFTRRSDLAIDYTTFGELAVIITSNWDVFGTIFSSRRAVEKVMNSLNVLRGPIAHCCPLADDEIQRLRLTLNDWFRMIG